MKHDPLADVFSVIKGTESIGRKECVVPASRLIKDVFEVMKKHKYIKGFEFIEDGKGGKYKVSLLGNINDCNIIKPRFSVGKDEFIKWEKRFLPANSIGILILTTSKGVTDQIEAKRQKTGGHLLGYVY